MNNGVLFIIAMISSAVCDLTDAIAGGISGALSSLFKRSDLMPKGVSPDATACARRSVAAAREEGSVGGLLRSSDSSKLSGSSSTRDMLGNGLVPVRLGMVSMEGFL